MTVAKYEEDELADNSDNEKCLFRVEVRAGKLKQKGTKKARKKGWILTADIWLKTVHSETT